MTLPENIASLIGPTDGTPDRTGMSGASILLWDDVVLKVQPDGAEADREARAMAWLRGKIPVPEVICHEKLDGRSYLLMTRLPGKMSCDRMYLADPESLTARLAEALEMLWAVDAGDCPLGCGLGEKLAMARENVERGLVDVDNVEPETFSSGGFRDPAHLLDWLERNRPAEDIVLSHGDFCLPNIFLDHGRVSGFLDLGRTGAADRYQDLALCHRSLRRNYAGRYASGVWMDFDPDALFRVLGLTPDREKLRYYTLLDELF